MVVQVVRAGEGEVFDVELEEKLLLANSEIARENSELLQRHGVRAIDVMGSTGSGKTSLVKLLIRKLKRKRNEGRRARWVSPRSTSRTWIFCSLRTWGT